jgi:hypothetical protein
LTVTPKIVLLAYLDERVDVLRDILATLPKRDSVRIKAAWFLKHAELLRDIVAATPTG